MKNFFRHFKTVMTHKWYVFTNMCKCGFFFRGLVHDTSKFSPKEYFISVKNYNGHYSPIVNERRNNGLYSDAFTHHTNHNKHHYEYWISEYNGDFVLTKMQYRYSIEYICDMIAASKTYLGKNYKKDEPLKFFNSRYNHYLMHSMNKEFAKILLEEYSKVGFKALKKKKTKKLYKEISARYPYNEYIRCYSLNNGFVRGNITPEFIEKIYSKKENLK